MHTVYSGDVRKSLTLVFDDIRAITKLVSIVFYLLNYSTSNRNFLL
jgi:hypothetical protein